MAILALRNRQLSYHVFGQGIPIVFIPPPVVGCAVFGRQVASLADRFQVILIELPGHARSEPTETPLTYPLIVQDVCILLDSLDIEKAVICGYSMGASVVLEFARLRPERMMGGVSISGFSEVSDFILNHEILAAVKVSNLQIIGPLAFTLALANADDKQSFHQMFRMGKRANCQNVKSMFQYALSYNCTDDLKYIDTPIRLVFGSKDHRLRKYAALLETALPNYKSVYIQNARHQIPLKHHQHLNSTIFDFVSSLR